MRWKKLICIVAAAVVAAGMWAAAARGQNLIGNQPEQSLEGVTPVRYLFPEQLTLPAGKLATVAMHFQVADGLHINSHTPNDDYLIPTVLTVPATSGVHLESADYPPGADITLPLDPKTKLSVYTGGFIIEAHILAAHGDHLVQARLRYQACNMSQCLPPKTITAAIDVIAK
jgi:hypothetical protein